MPPDIPFGLPSAESAGLPDAIIGSLPGLRDPFARQGVAIRSLVCLEVDPVRSSIAATLIPLEGDGRARDPIPLDFAPGHPERVSDLLRQVRAAISGPGEDVLLGQADLLREVLLDATAPLEVRGVISLGKSTASRSARLLLRRLFDLGLVAIGPRLAPEVDVSHFLASADVTSPDYLDSGGPGQITMSTLGRTGAFANQLFQYAFLKLYGLRHGAHVAVPDWRGRDFYGLHDPLDAGISLPRVAFPAFSVSEGALWEQAEPPIDVDFWGFFQELPPYYLPHRALLRRLFTPVQESSARIDAARARLTHDGRSPLVAVHLRRGDYRGHELPEFRLIPAQWYRDWFEQLRHDVPDAVLYVASDEPHARDYFADFSPRSSADLADLGLADDLIDFEIMRRADHLALCNSSFSRMAALLAPDTQKRVLPSLEARRFLPYDPWGETSFWTRFGDSHDDPPVDQLDLGLRSQSERPLQSQPVVNIDITDLLEHLLGHARVSGIQRVQTEIISGLLADPQRAAVNFTLFKGNGLARLDPALLDNIMFHLGSADTAGLREAIRAAMELADPYLARPGETLLLTGAFWAVADIGRLLQRLKNERITLGVLMHDILPITRPEFFKADTAHRLIKPVVEILALADFVVTASRYNQQAIADLLRGRNLRQVPTDVIPFAYGLPPLSAEGPTEAVPAFAELVGSRFILCVGTIENRKNPSYLFNLWRLLADAERADIPKLVFAGRRGWMVSDVLEQIEAADGLDGRIVVLEGLEDSALAWLYRHCLMTVFPSFEEGWGLPVGESLAHGKVCLASRAGGVPEIADGLVDYLDPYNVRDGYDRLVRYLDDPELIIRREAEIRQNLPDRTWQTFTDDLMACVLRQAGAEHRTTGPAAVGLPAEVFLATAIHLHGRHKEAIAGALSAELACVSGWGEITPEGVHARGIQSVLRFRPAGKPGARLNLVLKLAGVGRQPLKLKLRSASGSEATVDVAPGADIVTTLACQIERDGLLTVVMTPLTPEGRTTLSSDWVLRGFLYIDLLAVFSNVGKRPVPPTRQVGTATQAPRPPDVRLAPAFMAASRIALRPSERTRKSVATLDEFLTTPDASLDLSGGSVTHREEPLFAEPRDRLLFASRYRNSATARLGSIPDRLVVNRASDVFVSTSRLTEGSLFDRTGVVKDGGFLLNAPLETAWISRDPSGTFIEPSAATVGASIGAPVFVFYNGNLHNYYHWLIEGMLALDIMTQTMGGRLAATIMLPKSLDTNAIFDHRAMLKLLGLDGWPIIERPPHVVPVRDALWIETGDFMEDVPSQYVASFQKRIAGRLAGRRSRHGRRLFVNRLGRTRLIDNLAGVEAALRARGFETVTLERRDIEAQIAMFQGADFIVSAHGAGLSNLVFCNPRTRVLELMPESEMRPFFWLISQKLGLVHGMQFCPSGGDGGFQAAMTVDLNKLNSLLDRLEASTAA